MRRSPYLENRVPAIGTIVRLRDGRTATVLAGWYAKGKGGWRIFVYFGDGESVATVGLREFRVVPPIVGYR